MTEGSIEDAVARVAADRISGATALTLRGIEILRRVTGDRAALEAAAQGLCRAQPSMAGMRTAAALALGRDGEAALARLAERVARSAAAIGRVAGAVLGLRQGEATLRVVTYSRSAAVEAALLSLAASTDLVVACSESLPGLEGRDLAVRLANGGVRVELYSDAGLAVALPTADALAVGADAMGPDAFVNKAGTSAFCALAASCGVPAFVLAGREKIVPRAVFEALELRDESPAAPASALPPLLIRRAPLFERVSWGAISQVITDGGAVSPDEVFSAGYWREEAIRSI